MATKELLLQVLTDKSASEAERDDAAMDLGKFDGEDVIRILVQVASDPSTEEMVCSSCGESLADIFMRRGIIDNDLLKKLRPEAFSEAIGLIKFKHPDWNLSL
ncbi:hypothetical protein [Paenibacillus sp. sgz5001063]|uniref:hypothetical protein n=1 Tax=Paenibacillus sp. sgz5001063 TaxID=3242474 RepID=UPI0036D38F2A